VPTEEETLERRRPSLKCELLKTSDDIAGLLSVLDWFDERLDEER